MRLYGIDAPEPDATRAATPMLQAGDAERAARFIEPVLVLLMGVEIVEDDVKLAVRKTGKWPLVEVDFDRYKRTVAVAVSARSI